MANIKEKRYRQHALYLSCSRHNTLSFDFSTYPQKPRSKAPPLSQQDPSSSSVDTRKVRKYLLTFGKADHGKLGHGDAQIQRTLPTLVESLQDVNICRMASMSTYSLAVDVSANHYSYIGFSTAEYACSLLHGVTRPLTQLLVPGHGLRLGHWWICRFQPRPQDRSGATNAGSHTEQSAHRRSLVWSG